MRSALKCLSRCRLSSVSPRAGRKKSRPRLGCHLWPVRRRRGKNQLITSRQTLSEINHIHTAQTRKSSRVLHMANLVPSKALRVISESGLFISQFVQSGCHAARPEKRKHGEVSHRCCPEVYHCLRQTEEPTTPRHPAAILRNCPMVTTNVRKTYTAVAPHDNGDHELRHRKISPCEHARLKFQNTPWINKKRWQLFLTSRDYGSQPSTHTNAQLTSSHTLTSINS